MRSAALKVNIPRRNLKPDAPSTWDDPVTDAAQARKLTAAKLEWLAHVTSFRPHLSVLALCIAIKLVVRYVAMRDGRETFDTQGYLFVRPSQQQLANDLESDGKRVTRQAVAKALHKLISLGLVRVIKKGGSGRGDGDEFVLIKRNLAGCPSEPEKRNQATLKSATRRPEKRNQLGCTSSLSSEDLIPAKPGKKFSLEVKAGEVVTPPPDLFQRFLAIWPVKDAQPAAVEAAWSRHVIKPGIDPQLVLRAAQRWADLRHCRGEDAFVPFAGKWLKEQGWKNKPPPLEPEERDLIPYFRTLHGIKDDRLSTGVQKIIDGAKVSPVTENAVGRDKPVREVAIPPAELAKGLLASKSVSRLCNRAAEYLNPAVLSEIEARARTLDRQHGAVIAKLLMLLCGPSAKRLLGKLQDRDDLDASLGVEITAEADHRFGKRSWTVEGILEVLEDRVDGLRKRVESVEGDDGD